jgi:RNA-directed DNA polymerase
MSGCWRGHHGLLRRDRPSGLLDRGCRRVADKRVLALVKAFPASSPRTAPGGTHHRHPTRGILSPLLSNVALSVLDEHAAEVWARDSATFTARQRRRRHGLANWRLVRDADDFVLVVSGTRAQAETLREEVAAVLAQVGLRLSEQKPGSPTATRASTSWAGVSSVSSSEARSSAWSPLPVQGGLDAVKARVRALTSGMRNHPLTVLLHQLNPVLRGWTSYFPSRVSKVTCSYLRAVVWRRVVGWLRRKHPRSNWKQLRRRYLPGWWPTDGEVALLDPAAVAVTRYRYRAAHIPSPWTSGRTGRSRSRPEGLVQSRMRR